MGGEYETKVEAPVRARAGNKGDDDDVVMVKGIRFHKSRGQVHFHDDKAGLKCYVPTGAWWSAWQRLRNPVDDAPTSFTYQDVDNKTVLLVTSLLEGDAVKVSMEITAYTPPATYDRVWHALEEFTHRSASGG
jgi:hypothetical protein